MTARPKTAGIIGWPVGHSLSPVIHRHWAERDGIDAVYLPFLVEPGIDNLKRAVAAARAAGCAGLNVTLPHKENALKIADDASEPARAASAANMLTFAAHGVSADNSDIAGFREALKGGLGPKERPKRAVVLGAGGGARAVVIALKEIGVADILVLNRTREKAEALARDLCVVAENWAARNDALAVADIVVNATSLGMTGMAPLDIRLDGLPGNAVVADIVYSPLETPLLRDASARGLRRVEGLAMLMHQAVPPYERWFGGKAVVDAALRATLVAALGKRDRRVTIVGLTGSIGMGKSTALDMFREEGARVWNADEAVHRLYAKGGAAVAAMRGSFPEAIAAGAVDRDKLSAIVLRDTAAFARVEAIVHPLVAEDREAFVSSATDEGAELVVLDIPLLFEKGYAGGFDAVVVVSAPPDVQRTRVLARPGMTAEKFAAILAKQIADEEKRRRADYVISTGGSLATTRKMVAQVVADLRRRFAP